MIHKEDVRNQHQQALYYLYNWSKFSMKNVINDSMFYKFQTRLSELEIKYGKLSNREQIDFTNPFGNSSYYYIYSGISKDRILEVFNLLKKNE